MKHKRIRARARGALQSVMSETLRWSHIGAQGTNQIRVSIRQQEAARSWRPEHETFSSKVLTIGNHRSAVPPRCESVMPTCVGRCSLCGIRCAQRRWRMREMNASTDLDTARTIPQQSTPDLALHHRPSPQRVKPMRTGPFCGYWYLCRTKRKRCSPRRPSSLPSPAIARASSSIHPPNSLCPSTSYS